MPELPEVETVRQGLSKRLKGKTIGRILVHKPKMVRGSLASFTRQLKGKRVDKIDRRGKLLIIRLIPGPYFLLVHLKMTGQLIYVQGDQVLAGGHSSVKASAKTKAKPAGKRSRAATVAPTLPNTYSHIIVEFTDDSTLYFNDMRQFGYMELVSEARLAQVLASYGPEPLDKTFTLEQFSTALARRSNTSLKAALLDQTIIAGLGNIYVDEACFKAGIRPTRRVSTLTPAERKRLFQAIPLILKKAITHRGTTFSNYSDDKGEPGNFTRLLKVYGRGGQRCVRCGEMLLRETAAGRGTVYCPTCQR